MGVTHFKEQGLISGSGGVEALRPVERALVAKSGAGELEPAWPVHRPISRKVVSASLQATDSQVAGGYLHLLHPDAPCSSRNYHNRVIL